MKFFEAIPDFQYPSNSLIDEWSKYINLPPPENDDFQVEKFWDENQQTLPLLSKCALNYLYVPAAAADERSFSSLKNIESDQRLQMSNKTVADSLFCLVNSWLLSFWIDIFKFTVSRA